MADRRASLDTGFLKSGWTWFWIAPFALFFVAVSLLLLVDLFRDGFAAEWWHQAIGLSMSLGFSIILGWIWLRGASREQVWITEDTVRIRRSWPFGIGKTESQIERSKIAYFVVSMAETVFDIRLRTKDGEVLPLVIAHRIKECDDWKRLLGTVAPVG